MWLADLKLTDLRFVSNFKNNTINNKSDNSRSSGNCKKYFIYIS